MSVFEISETITLGSSGLTINLLQAQDNRVGIEVLSTVDRAAVLESIDVNIWPHSGETVIPSVLMPSNKSEPRRVACEFLIKIPAPITLQSVLMFQGDHNVRLVDHLETALNQSFERKTGFAALVDAYYQREGGEE